MTNSPTSLLTVMYPLCQSMDPSHMLTIPLLDRIHGSKYSWPSMSCHNKSNFRLPVCVGLHHRASRQGKVYARYETEIFNPSNYIYMYVAGCRWDQRTDLNDSHSGHRVKFLVTLVERLLGF